MIVYKYLDEAGALATIDNCRVLIRNPDNYDDDSDSLFDVKSDDYTNSYDLFVNYLFFKNLCEELFENKAKPIRLKKLILPYSSNLKDAYRRIKETGKYYYQDYLIRYRNFVYKYLDTKPEKLKLQFRITMERKLLEARELSLISCFCESYTEPLMWDRYGDGGRGACIAFDIDESKCRKVIYEKRKYQFKLFNTLEYILGHMIAKREIDSEKKEFEFIVEPFFRKNKVYSYEKERRIVLSKNKLSKEDIIQTKIKGKDEFLLKMSNYKTIYLGTRASKKLIEEALTKQDLCQVFKMDYKKNSRVLIAKPYEVINK